MTTVRVSSEVDSFVLALVRIGSAGTLCHVDGKLRGDGRDTVTMARRNGKWIALARGARRANHNSGARPSDEDSRKM